MHTLRNLNFVQPLDPLVIPSHRFYQSAEHDLVIPIHTLLELYQLTAAMKEQARPTQKKS